MRPSLALRRRRRRPLPPVQPSEASLAEIRGQYEQAKASAEHQMRAFDRMGAGRKAVYRAVFFPPVADALASVGVRDYATAERLFELWFALRDRWGDQRALVMVVDEARELAEVRNLRAEQRELAAERRKLAAGRPKRPKKPKKPGGADARADQAPGGAADA